MGAPIPEFDAIEQPAAAALLSALATIAPAERRRHASVLHYWLSIRGEREFPPIRDLDPLELSDAAQSSILVEMIGGGEDGEIRHLGQNLKTGAEPARIGEAASKSLLSCIATKLPIIAATRQPLTFEEQYLGEHGAARCWVTLLPFSAAGSWIDYVYGFVSLEPAKHAADEPPLPPARATDAEPDEIDVAGGDQAVCEQPERELEADAASDCSVELRPGFSARFFETLASVGGFYGMHAQAEHILPAEAAGTIGSAPEVEPEPQAEAESRPAPESDLAPEPEFEPEPDAGQSMEGPLQSKLADVRAKADEARLAKLRSNVALYEGLGAAYDFALDAEGTPEEYLRLVEAQGLKIQLRSPMTPVVKLAFDGLCDEATIAQLEAVLSWALKMDLPRGSLAERIEAEGGIGPILNGLAQAA